MGHRASLRAASLLISTLASAVVGSLALAADPPATVASAPEPPVSSKPIRGTLVAPAGQWGRIEFVNVRTYPYDGRPGSALKRPPLGPTSKTIFQSPEVPIESDLPVGQLIHLVYQPTFATRMPPPGGPPHYHTFWEWGYTLKGDSIMAEPVTPLQKNGMLYRKKEGGWLTRPPYSLHGGSWVTGGGRNQLPYHLIIFEEGDGHVINAGGFPGGPGSYRSRDGKGPPSGNPDDADYRKAKGFTRPWLLDSTRDVDWEDDPLVKGRFVKWLDEDAIQGFRAQMVKIPPGWTPPEDYRKTYNETANVLRYMIWGSMKVWTFKNPADSGQAYRVSEDHFIYQPPRAIWGFGEGPVSDEGAIWLEVTYSKGLKHDPDNGPIEKPKPAL